MFMKKKEKSLNKKEVLNAKFSDLMGFFKMVSDENRLKILLLLEDGEMTVTNIHSKLKLPQNLTSHHITKLKGLGLLNEKREGTFRRYSVNGKKLKEYGKLAKDLLKM